VHRPDRRGGVRMNTMNGRVNGSARPVNTVNTTVNEPTDSVNTPKRRAAVDPTRSANRRTDHGDEGGKKPPAAARIVEMAREQYRFVMSPDGRPYAVALAGPNIALPLRNKGGLRQRLARQFADAYPGEVASQSALADAMTVLEGIAEDTDPEPVHLRVGRDPAGAIVVDLGSADGRAVVVTATGWNVVDRAPVLFRRSGAMAPMPAPVLDGDGLAKLHALLNMDEPSFHQLVAWLVAAWIPPWSARASRAPASPRPLRCSSTSSTRPRPPSAASRGTKRRGPGRRSAPGRCAWTTSPPSRRGSRTPCARP
jgi:hypothetical protein